MNYIKLVWRYGLFDLYTMNKFITDMLKNFSNIYKLQENRQAFTSVPDMLTAMGGKEMYTYTQLTARQTLEKIGLKPLLIDELVAAVMRVNYGQDVTLNGFAGIRKLICRVYSVTPRVNYGDIQCGSNF